MKSGFEKGINKDQGINVNINCMPFSQLTIDQLYAVLRLRSEVFVVEQNCIYQDMDNKDKQAGVYHLLMTAQNELVGYARLLPQKLSFPTPSIGRVIVAPNARSKGLGRELIKQCIDYTQRLWPNQAITIGAQSHLSVFYQSFGFTEISTHYLEDGIAHVDMQLLAK